MVGQDGSGGALGSHQHPALCCNSTAAGLLPPAVTIHPLCSPLPVSLLRSVDVLWKTSCFGDLEIVFLISLPQISLQCPLRGQLEKDPPTPAGAEGLGWQPSPWCNPPLIICFAGKELLKRTRIQSSRSYIWSGVKLWICINKVGEVRKCLP